MFRVRIGDDALRLIAKGKLGIAEECVVGGGNGRVRRAFKWAVENELIPVAVHQALAAVAGLQAGRTDAAECEPVAPVDDAVVDATLPFLNRHARGLVEFQRLTGCRPGEACAIRRCDLDTGGAVWLYRPAQHKTGWRGKSRVIAVGPNAQKVLCEFFTPNLPDYLFSPRLAVRELHASRTANRKTPKYPSHLKRNAAKRTGSPKRAPSGRYTVTAYEHAIARACDKAFPPPGRLAQGENETRSRLWGRLTETQRDEVERWQRDHRWAPNRLRHSHGTEVRRPARPGWTTGPRALGPHRLLHRPVPRPDPRHRRLVYGDEAARGEVASRLAGPVGEEAARTVEGAVATSRAPRAGAAALVVSLVTLFVGATGVFVELQEALNDVWKVRPQPGRPIRTFVRGRVMSFGMVLGVGFQLLVSLVLGTAVEAAGRFAAGRLAGSATALLVANLLVVFAGEVFLFGMIFKVLPDADLAWRDVLTGAVLTAALFNVGKYLVGLFLGYSGVASAFGAAGSLMAFLVWIYFSALVVVFGGRGGEGDGRPGRPADPPGRARRGCPRCGHARLRQRVSASPRAGAVCRAVIGRAVYAPGFDAGLARAYGTETSTARMEMSS